MTDRLPPQSLDAEQAVLGSILIDRDAIIEVADFLTADDFYRQAHGQIFAAMLELYGHNEPIDIVTVAEAVERAGQLEAIGGAGYLSQLANDTPTAVHVAQYGRIVERKALLRRLIQSAGRIAGIGYEDGPDVQESIDRAEAELFAVSQRRARDGFSPLVDLLHQALNVAEHASVDEAKTVGLFSLEMSKEQLVQRMLSSVAGIDSQRLRSGFLEDMDFARIAPAMEKLSRAPLYIDDTPSISTMELRTKARRLQAERGLDLLIVDYLQLMQADTVSRDANRVQEVTEISRGLKALARELKIPVLALSQLSRQPELRESREPRLSDLRESGAIEQDADLVLFLWREKEKPAEDETADGEVVNLRLAKHRNGPTGDTKLWFRKSQTRFVSLASERYAEAV
jgi:replicative DNA helicase